MKITSRIYLVLALALGVLGIVQCIRLQEFFGSNSVGYLITLLPSLVLGLAYLIGRRPHQNYGHTMLIIVSAFAMLFLVCMSLFFEVFLFDSVETTDVSRYQEMLDDHPYSNLVDHFPKAFPADARNIHFSCQPNSLFPWTHIQLRYTLPQAKIADLYGIFVARKTKSVSVDNPTGMPTTCFFHTSDARIDELRKGNKAPRAESLIFPEDYEIIVLDPLSEHVSMDRGECRGVAISKKRSEIVYWMEVW